MDVPSFGKFSLLKKYVFLTIQKKYTFSPKKQKISGILQET